MRIHERLFKVQEAKLEFSKAAQDLQQKYDLTNIEMLQILTDSPTIILKFMLREERHPEDPNKKADEE